MWQGAGGGGWDIAGHATKAGREAAAGVGEDFVFRKMRGAFLWWGWMAAHCRTCLQGSPDMCMGTANVPT